MLTIFQAINDAAVPTGMDAMYKISSRMGIRLLIDIATVFILVRLIYYPLYKQRDFFFMFVIFNIIIFFISFLLNKVDLSMGAAFGLFAVFSMLRYRTESISIKDMTYLFLCIAIGLVTAVTKIKDTPDSQEYLFLVGLNGGILLITFLLESDKIVKKETTKLIIYENIELIQSHRREELLADIKKRTGLNTHRIAIQRINFLKDSALIKIYYYE
ncbi:MAG: DUF4956 domain-containing protein [Bacteroidetes bacterium]|nr:DUF4956 domain-containing protein [Bacteroidota bacterium]